MMPRLSIDHYNHEIGKLYAVQPDFFMLSPAFCRCEGQTHLFSLWASGKSKVTPRYFYSFVRFAGKVLQDLLFSLIAKKGEFNSNPGQSIFVFSYFDLRNNDHGTLREEYFRGILNDNPNVYCFYKILAPGISRRGFYYLKLISSLDKRFYACAEHSFISPWMILKAIYLTSCHWVIFKKIRFQDDVDSSLLDLLKSAHSREIRDGTVYFGYLQKLLFERLLSHHPKTILSVWENFPWERILEYTRKRISPATITKGFQHTGFSKKLLQFYPSRLEGNLNTYPDFILCNGYVNQEELKNNIPIRSNIIVGAALRQDRMLQKGIGKIEKLIPEKPINIAFAFSWDQSNYESILEDLKMLPKDVTVYLKFHPDYPHWLRKNNFPKKFINSHASWVDIGLICPLVLASDNSLMFEGFYHGMHTAVYEADNSGLEKRDFGPSPLVHLTKRDLPKILSKSVIDQINSSTRKIFETRYLEKYFVQRDLTDSKTLFMDS